MRPPLTTLKQAFQSLIPASPRRRAARPSRPAASLLALATAFCLPALAQAAETPDGLAGLDLLPGTGAISYQLTHGGVLQKTLSVRAGGHPLRAGQDFLFNPSTGSITLTEPLPPGASISARYRYNPDADTQRNPFTFKFDAPGFTSGLKLNAVFSSPGGMLGFNTSGSQVTGLMLDQTSLGFGKLSGMSLLSRKGESPLAAFARPRDARSALVSQLTGGATPQASTEQLNQYGLDGIKIGSGTIGINYRKVGKDFDFSSVAGQFKDGPKKDLFDLLQKEKGLETLGFSGDYGFSAGLKSKMGFSRISDDKGTATQQSVSLNGKLFDVTYNALKVDSGFAHLKESALQNVGDLTAGQDRKDMVANLRPTGNLSLQTAVTRLQSGNGDTQTVQRNSMQLKAGQNTNFGFVRQQTLSRLAASTSSAKKEVRQTLTFDRQSKGGIILQAKQDTLQSTDGTSAFHQRSTLFHIETDQKKSTLLLFERKTDKDSTGKGQTAQKFNFATHIARLAAVQWSANTLENQENAALSTYEKKLRIETDAKKPLSFLYNSESSKKQDGAAQAIEQIMLGAQIPSRLALKDTDFKQQDGPKTTEGNNLEFTLKPISKVQISGNVMDRTESDRGNTDETNVVLNAPVGNLEVVAEHHEAEVQSENFDRTINGLSLAAPAGGNQGKVTGSYLDQTNKGAHEKRVQSLGYERGLVGGRILMELGNVRYVQGHPFQTVALGYTSSQDPKRRLRYTTLYRKMAANDGAALSEYQHSLDYKVSPRFSFSFKTFQNDAARNGFYYNITAVRGMGFSCDAKLSSKLAFSAGFDNEHSLQDGKAIYSRNLSLKGNLNAMTTIDLSYLSYICAKWQEDKPTHSAKLSVQRAINDEDKFVLTGEAKFWKDGDPTTADHHFTNGRLDFVRVF